MIVRKWLLKSELFITRAVRVVLFYFLSIVGVCVCVCLSVCLTVNTIPAPFETQNFQGIILWWKGRRCSEMVI